MIQQVDNLAQGQVQFAVDEARWSRERYRLVAQRGFLRVQGELQSHCACLQGIAIFLDGEPSGAVREPPHRRVVVTFELLNSSFVV